MSLWTYKAMVVRWVDADTLDVEIDLGFHTHRRERLRLLGSAVGVNSPEPNSPDGAVRERARAATTRANEMAPVGGEVVVRTERAVTGDPRDGFGRFLAQVITPAGVNVGDALLEEGHAVPYERKR